MSRNELTCLRVLIVALRLPTLVFLLYQKGRDSRIFQAQDGYDRRDSEQQQVTADEDRVTADEDRGRLVRRP
jgi:hypothetical protein